MTVPPRPIDDIRRALRRGGALSGAYGLFALVLSSLVGVSVGLAVALLASDFTRTAAPASVAVGGAAFVIALVGLVTRASRWRAALDAALTVTILAIMLIDRWI